MTSRAARRSLIAAVALGAVVSGSASAAPAKAPRPPAPLVYSDDAGDALPPLPELDITGVRYAQVNANKTLEVSLTLGAPPSDLHGISYEAYALVEGCGYARFQYGQTVTGSLLGPGLLYLNCGSAPDPNTGSTTTLLQVKTAVKGNVLTWSTSVKGLPKEVRAGEWGSFSSRVLITDPVMGLFGPGMLQGENGAVDYAASDATWRLR